MDWKEDLKLSIKRSVAKKGRRSNQQHESSSSTKETSASSHTASSSQILSTSPTPHASSSANSLQLFTEKEDSMSIDLDVSTDDQTHVKTPPKKATAGWADSGSKSGRNKSRNLFEEERFNSGITVTTISPKEEDIPIIPDLDDMQDEMLMNEIVEPPSVTVNRVVTLKELDSDLLKQSAFSTLEDVDLSILTKHLQPQEMLDEPDEIWEWDQVFTEISAEINLESSTNKSDKTDETFPPTQYLT